MNNYFEKNPSLIYINSEGNALITIPSDNFIDNIHLEFVYFEDNKCIQLNAVGKTEIDSMLQDFKEHCNQNYL